MFLYPRWFIGGRCQIIDNIGHRLACSSLRPNLMLSDETTDLYASVDVLASDFIERYRNGDRPTIEEYALRHPDLSGPIREFFPLALSLEKVKIDQQSSASGGATLAGRQIERLGDFQVVREIGRGGMGIVYEALQNSLGRKVAIKVFPKQVLLDEDALARLHHEAKTAAAMHHTNIVPIFGTGESEGTHYLVMQLVNGSALDRRIELRGSERFRFREAAAIGRQVADALGYSHANHVLHRDIKPSNILIDDEGMAKVTDFGLARNMSDDPTMTHVLSGSPRYMAPERFQGDSDPRSDVYSLGLTLYEMLAGSPAFARPDPHQLIEAMRLHEVQSLRSFRSDIPVDLETIVAKAMSREPTHRYQSAMDLRDDLDRFLADEPIHARRISLPQRLVRWCRRNPRMALSFTIAASSLLVATIASTAGWAFTSAANRRTTRALIESEQTMDLALQSLDGVVDLVSVPSTSAADFGFDEAVDAAWTLTPSLQSAEVLKSIQPLYERLSQQSPNRVDIVEQMTLATVRLAFIQRQLGHRSDAIETLSRGLQLIQTRSTWSRVTPSDKCYWLASLHNELGEVYSEELCLDESKNAFEETITLLANFDQANPKSRLQLARAHVSLGDPPPLRRRSSATTPITLSERHDHLRIAADLLEELHVENSSTSDIEILRARVMLALSHRKGSPMIRRSSFQQAVEILRKQLEVEPNDFAVRYAMVNTLAGVNLRRDGRSHQERMHAAMRLEEALRELEKLRSQFPESPIFSISEVHVHHKLANIARSEKDYTVAAEELGRAVSIQSALVSAAPDNATHRCWRALLNRSVSEICRLRSDLVGERSAIKDAVADISAIRISDTKNPFVIQTTTIIMNLQSETRGEKQASPVE